MLKLAETGQHVTSSVVEHLSGLHRSVTPGVSVRAGAPFRWVSPQRLVAGEPTPRGDLLLWSDSYQRFPIVVASQNGHEIGRRRVGWPAAPGRVFRAPAGVVAAADPRGSPITITLSQ